MTCPRREILEAWLGETLAAEQAAPVGEHQRSCPDCARLLLELEPARLFAAIAPRTLPPGEWQGIRRRLRSVLAEEPRGRRLRERLLAFGWSRGAAAALAAGALIVVSLGLLAIPEPLEPSRPGRAAAGASGIARLDFGPREGGDFQFSYLSNPDAQVTHILLDPKVPEQPVRVTMVVDNSLADVF